MELREAAEALYMAGRWECGAVRGDVAAQLWANLRDALGLPVGTATAHGVNAAPPDRSQIERYRVEPFEHGPGEWHVLTFADGHEVQIFTEKPIVVVEAERH